MTSQRERDWFNNCGGFQPRHSLDELREGVRSGLLNIQDEYGYTALHFSVFSGWIAGTDALLAAGANIEVRDYRTGSTPLYDAVLKKNSTIVALLLSAGASPDAPNHWGVTPRRWMPTAFEHLPVQSLPLPPPRIQNAEHLADQHYPHFEIPNLDERISLSVGQAVDLYVYGPKSETKQDTVKVRIVARSGEGRKVRYAGVVKTPLERTHLAPGTERVEFGPENVATVYLTRPTSPNE